MRRIIDQLFAVNLKKVLEAYGHLPAFERALAKPDPDNVFAVGLDNPPYQKLHVEVLPPEMNRFNVPAVAVSHTFVQNGDLMRDPEIVFAVKPEGWVPYECTQDPLGHYASAFDADGKFDEKISADMRQLSVVWARNLIGQGWAGQQADQSQSRSIKPGL
ncbi:MAG: hypothetical protein LBH01_03960 [Verrucomicrobiales bacterium]|jgi:hypothetical protein|nr:hypothetical protein [Verrucomicrobiales bacterium]